jgi:hypothetical protein
MSSLRIGPDSINACRPEKYSHRGVALPFRMTQTPWVELQVGTIASSEAESCVS